MKITDGKRTVEINIMTWNGRLPGHISGCLTRLTHVTSC